MAHRGDHSVEELAYDMAPEGDVMHIAAVARETLAEVDVPADVIELASRLCMRLGTDGLRGELTLIRAARAVASLEAAPLPDAVRAEILTLAREAGKPSKAKGSRQ